ncbi:MAG: hypothetical protein EBY62_05335 [Cellvibrionales bacterium]|nr:hypothetical protein [Cellvibrionales bacterium]
MRSVMRHNHYEFITKDGYLFKNSNSDIGHNLLKSWNELYKLCESTGIKLYTLDQVDPQILDLVIYMDRPRQEPEVHGASKVLILYEPELILPDNWDTAYHDQFSRVLTWNDKLCLHKKYQKHNFTVDWKDRLPCECSRGDFFTNKLAVMIQTAKNIPGSLYEKRIEVIQWFKDNAIFDFDLYGRGWDIRTIPFYKGMTSNKLATYANYRFAITFENTDKDIGYISDEGLLYICGRAKDMIIRGGENIYPSEVEACLLTMPDCVEAAVVGIPSDQWGEEVAAVIRCAPGHDPSPKQSSRRAAVLKAMI